VVPANLLCFRPQKFNMIVFVSKLRFIYCSETNANSTPHNLVEICLFNNIFCAFCDVTMMLLRSLSVIMLVRLTLKYFLYTSYYNLISFHQPFFFLNWTQHTRVRTRFIQIYTHTKMTVQPQVSIKQETLLEALPLQ